MIDAGELVLDGTLRANAGSSPFNSGRPTGAGGSVMIQELCASGFEVVATRGSHAKLRRVTEDDEKQTLTVSLHKGLDPGTIRAIYRQAARFIPESELRIWFYGD